MSTGGFSLDQLMELAGLSVSEAGIYPPHTGESLAMVPDTHVSSSVQSPPALQRQERAGRVRTGQ